MHSMTKVMAALMGAAMLAVAPQAAMAAKGAVLLEMKKSAAEDPWSRYDNWPDENWSDFNTMRNDATKPPGRYQHVFGAIEDGDPKKGRELAFERRGRGGGCLACHIFPGATLPGNVGPDLSTVGTWGRSDWQLYNYIYDPRVFNPQTMMPPWGVHGVYSPDEIRHIVSYLKTLKEPAKFKDVRDDPNKRVKEEAAYDATDPFQNPAWGEGEKGEALFKTKGPNGKACSDCHANPKKAFRTWGARMPYYEPRMKKVINIEEFITRHGRATTGADYLMQSDENNELAIYLRILARGQTIAVKFDSPAAKAEAMRGKELMSRKIGKLNFACTDCHGLAANKWIRGQYLGPSEKQLGHHPYYRTSQGQIWTVRKRFQWCGVAIQANELPPDAPEYGAIEYYLTSLSNGEKITTPGMGH